MSTKIIDFSKFKEGGIEKFLTCPVCGNQKFLIKKDIAYICRVCDTTFLLPKQEPLEFKNE